jgi:hypothetical protein
MRHHRGHPTLKLVRFPLNVSPDNTLWLSLAIVELSVREVLKLAKGLCIFFSMLPSNWLMRSGVGKRRSEIPLPQMPSSRGWAVRKGSSSIMVLLDLID